MVTLEEGREFDNLTQLYRWLEKLLRGGSPGEDWESAGAQGWVCGVSLPPCAKSPLKWPRKGTWCHSGSSSPPESQIYPI